MSKNTVRITIHFTLLNPFPKPFTNKITHKTLSETSISQQSPQNSTKFRTKLALRQNRIHKFSMFKTVCEQETSKLYYSLLASTRSVVYCSKCCADTDGYRSLSSDGHQQFMVH